MNDRLMSAEMNSNPVVRVARWLRHHSNCELRLHESPRCTCGLNAVLAELCPEIVAKASQPLDKPNA